VLDRLPPSPRGPVRSLSISVTRPLSDSLRALAMAASSCQKSSSSEILVWWPWMVIERLPSEI